MNKCKYVEGTTDKVIAKPQIPVYPALKNVGLDFEYAFGIPIEDYTVIFVPAVGLFGPCSDLGILLRAPMTMGVIINCLKDIWYVESEPTKAEAFGIMVYSEKRKPIMCGEGKVYSIEDQKSGVLDYFRFFIKSVYAYVSSSPRKDSVEGKGQCDQKGNATISISYKIEF